MNVSQTTFDEVVKENIEEFGMTSQEAIEDAKKEFVRRGFNLDLIDLSGGEGLQQLNSFISIISNFSNRFNECHDSHGCGDVHCKNNDEKVISNNDILESLKSLKLMCLKSNEFHQRNRNHVLKGGCLSFMYKILNHETNTEILISVLDFVIIVTKNDETRDFFEPGGSVCMNRLFKTYFENVDLLKLVIKLCSRVAKSENNKFNLMKVGWGENICQILENDDFLNNIEKWEALLQNIFVLLKELCTNNDLRSEMSCAFENGKYFIKNEKLLLNLIHLLENDEKYPTLISFAMIGLKSLLTNNESVKIMTNLNISDVLISILTSKQLQQLQNTLYSSLIRSSFGLIRNLCIDDDTKHNYIKNGIIEMILYYLNTNYFDDVTIVENSIALLSTLTLRNKSASAKVIELDGARVIEKSMRSYSSQASIQKNCCCLVRNIASRCDVSHQIFLDLNFELLIREAGRNVYIAEDAYAALRDLRCDVKKIKLDAEGNVVNDAYTVKANFNPVFEETVDLMNIINLEAKAPFPI